MFTIKNMKEESPGKLPLLERREFLKMGLVVTGVFAGGSILSLVSNAEKVFASAAEFAEKYPYKPHYSMVIRQNLCIDCERCLFNIHFRVRFVKMKRWRNFPFF